MTYLFALVFGTLILTNLFFLGGGPMTNAESAADDVVTQARVGQEFAIKIGQQVQIGGEDLQVRFAAVPEDSRCPADVNCVWAGNAEVAVDLTQGLCTKALKLNTNPQSADEGKTGGYRVRLVMLEPYPRSDRKTASGDYTATLLITKE